MTSLIFGVSGQDGYYLQELCGKQNIQVRGVSRQPGPWVQGSVGDRSLVESLVRELKPDFIFHLAASSTTAHKDVFENHETISTGTLNILESALKFSPGSRIFITGSGVQFRNEGKPIRETDPFEAASLYSVARIHSVYAARYYRSLGLKAYVGYLFHHESPLRKPGHVSMKTSQAIKRIAGGIQEKITLGDISVRKEWAYAGDIAEGILKLVSQDTVFEATIGTGKAYSIREWLQTCFDKIGKPWEDYVLLPENNFVPEYELLVSDPTTIFSLGWQPRTSFSQLAEIMLR